MSFRDIRGQDKAIGFLTNALRNGRISHAYIFLGPRGVGRKLTALNFAKALNCASADSNEKPCDRCVPCKKIDALNHPDIFLLKPDKEGSSVKIDRIREMINSVSLKPYEGRKKVYVIDDASVMTPEASNALLKTLEEPASDSVIILIVDNIGDVPVTIASRSQVVRFFSLATEEVKRILMKEHKMDEEKAHILAAVTSGRLGDAVRYHADENFFEKRRHVIDSLVGGTFFDSDFADTAREEFGLHLDIMLTWYRDILITKVSSGMPLVNIDRRDAIAKEAGAMLAEDIDGIMREIISTGVYLSENANPKLAMAVLGLRCQCTK